MILKWFQIVELFFGFFGVYFDNFLSRCPICGLRHVVIVSNWNSWVYSIRCCCSMHDKQIVSLLTIVTQRNRFNGCFGSNPLQHFGIYAIVICLWNWSGTYQLILIVQCTQYVNCLPFEFVQRYTNAIAEINGVVIQLDNWHLFPAKIQRVLPIIIQNVQQPVVIKCFGNVLCARKQLRKVNSIYRPVCVISCEFAFPF